MRQSAGLLVFRLVDDAIEVLLVHPGGPFWVKKDQGAWSIPKGELAEGEDPRAAAVREFTEETGGDVRGDLLPLSPVTQRGGKVVHAWAVRGELDPAELRSNEFSMEWPPRSGRVQSFPEVDRAAWFPLEVARLKILQSQVPLLDELERMLRA